MSVGKGSLARAAKVNEVTEKTKRKVSAPNKKKFEAISKITCDLPIYLL